MFIVGGACFIVLGIIIFMKAGPYKYGHYIDFTGYNIIGGSIFVLIGILLIVSDIKKRKRGRSKEHT
ncbi:MAG: hypothetical protein AB7Y74_15170 [Syntrophorhabdus sp.]